MQCGGRFEQIIEPPLYMPSSRLTNNSLDLLLADLKNFFIG